jgi:hypothetical protein
MTRQMQRRRANDVLIRSASTRLTGRDRAICDALYEHRVLTVGQVHELHFGSLERARKRLVELYELRVVDRFRPYRERGSFPFHYLLDELGAALIAAERGVDPSELDWTRAKALRLIDSSQLRHLVEANGFFTRLALALRERPELRPSEWWGQRRCAKAWGELVRPDGFARLAARDRSLELWLEWDRSTETHARLAEKFERYADLEAALERPVAVAIVIPTSGREREVLRVLREGVPVRVLVTCAERHRADPLARNWLEPDREARLSLPDFAEEIA